MRGLVALAIRGYQRFISPHKGFSCAYRVHTGRCSCSAFGRRAVARHGTVAGLRLLDARLQRCAAVHRIARRQLHAQQGVMACDCVPPYDIVGCTDADGATSTACEGLDCLSAVADCGGVSNCDWPRRRRAEPMRYVQIKPATRQRERASDSHDGKRG